MIYQVGFCKRRNQWRIYAYDRDMCGAINEAVALETAMLLNALILE